MTSWLNDAEVKTAEDQNAERKASLVAAIESQRKAAEAEGVIVNGIRYSGDEKNRAALLEAVLSSRESGQTVFASWKDSDGEFHSDHPFADVEQALGLIGHRRGLLIGLEGQYIGKVESGALADVSGLVWDV